LRENRDHFHVFAFVDGARPSESLISESLGKTSAVKALKETKETKPAPKVSSRQEKKVSSREEKHASKKAPAKKRKR
jgi:hypothetical protein